MAHWKEKNLLFSFTLRKVQHESHFPHSRRIAISIVVYIEANNHRRLDRDKDLPNPLEACSIPNTVRSSPLNMKEISRLRNSSSALVFYSIVVVLTFLNFPGSLLSLPCSFFSPHFMRDRNFLFVASGFLSHQSSRPPGQPNGRTSEQRQRGVVWACLYLNLGPSVSQDLFSVYAHEGREKKFVVRFQGRKFWLPFFSSLLLIFEMSRA